MVGSCVGADSSEVAVGAAWEAVDVGAVVAVAGAAVVGGGLAGCVGESVTCADLLVHDTTVKRVKRTTTKARVRRCVFFGNIMLGISLKS